jgi:uncharacterized protein (DUF58 family)
VTVTLQPKLALFAGLAAAGLICGLIFSRPELILAAAPLLFALVIDLAAPRPRAVRGRIVSLPEQALEQDEIVIDLQLESDTRCCLEFILEVPPELEPPRRSNPVTVLVAPGEARLVGLPARCKRWGVAEIRAGAVRVRAPFGLLQAEQAIALSGIVRVLPLEPTVRDLVRPLATQLFTGNQLAPAKGVGIEFADVREYVPGDRPREINWRATARRGSLITNQHHVERNADVTILLDAFGNGQRGSGTTFDDAVRAASAIARQALNDGNRVGLLHLGSRTGRIDLRVGTRQLYRIIDALLASEVAHRSHTGELGRIPRRALSPRALVIALTPLLDEQSVDDLLALRGRGYDLLVVEIESDHDPGAQLSSDELLTLRFNRLVRESLRARFLVTGTPLVRWQTGQQLQSALGEVRAFRRRAERIRFAL